MSKELNKSLVVFHAIWGETSRGLEGCDSNPREAARIIRSLLCVANRGLGESALRFAFDDRPALQKSEPDPSFFVRRSYVING